MVLPNSAQKQIFMDEIFVVRLSCIRWKHGISPEELSAALLRLVKSINIFNFEILGYTNNYGTTLR